MVLRMGRRNARQIVVKPPHKRFLASNGLTKIDPQSPYEKRRMETMRSLLDSHRFDSPTRFRERVVESLESHDAAKISATLRMLESSETTSRFRDAIVPFLSSRNHSVASNAFGALAHIDHRRVVEESRKMIRAKKKYPPFTIALAIVRLAGAPNPRDRGFILPFLKSPDFDVRRAALDWVEFDLSPSSVNAVWPLVKDPVITIRGQAVRVLKRLGARGAFALNKAVSEPSKVSTMLDPSKSVQRYPIERTGTVAIALGGKLFGRAIARVVSPKSLQAWLAAEAAGIPVEPLLRRNGKVRAHTLKTGRLSHYGKRGEMLVYAGVLEGPSVADFLSKKRNKRWKGEIQSQIHHIRDTLNRRKISHGHPHEGNFVVMWEKKGGKKWPKVYLIDFDQSYSW